MTENLKIKLRRLRALLWASAMLFFLGLITALSSSVQAFQPLAHGLFRDDPVPNKTLAEKCQEDIERTSRELRRLEDYVRSLESEQPKGNTTLRNRRLKDLKNEIGRRRSYLNRLRARCGNCCGPSGSGSSGGTGGGSGSGGTKGSPAPSTNPHNGQSEQSYPRMTLEEAIGSARKAREEMVNELKQQQSKLKSETNPQQQQNLKRSIDELKKKLADQDEILDRLPKIYSSSDED